MNWMADVITKAQTVLLVIIENLVQKIFYVLTVDAHVLQEQRKKILLITFKKYTFIVYYQDCRIELSREQYDKRNILILFSFCVLRWLYGGPCRPCADYNQ